MKITIVGAAGVVGSCAAFAVAGQGLAEELVLVDTRQNVAANHALDIHAAMVGERNMTVRAGGFEDTTGSDIVIITAGIHLPAVARLADKLTPNIPIIHSIAQNIQRYCPRAVVITVTNPVDYLNYTVYLSTALERRQIIGFIANDTTRFIMATARALGIDATRVKALAVGEHPRAPLQLFSTIKVDGKPYQLDENLKGKLKQELGSYLSSLEALNAGRTAGWTSAAGLARIVKYISQDSQQVIPCSCILDGEYGYRNISCGVPAVIGRQGISRIVEIEMSATERRDFDKIARSIQEDSGLVRQSVGPTR
jgi:malate dehydrogenase